MTALGHGLSSRLRWYHDRCSSDSRRLAATPKSAESGQKQTSTGANTGTVQVGRKSIAELITGRIGTRPLWFKERAKFLSPSFLVIRILLKSELQHSLDSPLRFGPRQCGLKGGDGVEEPVRGRQRNLVDETLRGGDGASIEGGNSARERIDEAVQLGVWERPVDISVPFRGVAVEVVRAENDFERAAAADQMWEAFGAAAAGMHAHPDLGLAESRVFARRETHVTGEDELATAAAHAASDLCDTDHRGLCETHERIHQNREAGRPHGCRDVPRLAGQIKVGEIEVGNRALEYDDAQCLTDVHPNKQILEASKDRCVQNVERRIIEYDPPVGRRFLDHPDGRCCISFSHGSHLLTPRMSGSAT